MLKKALISICSIILMAGLISCSSEPDPEKESKRLVSVDDVKNEPPMTEDEILLFIKILPEFALVEGVDPVKEMELYKKYKLTKNRFHYLRNKIMNASLIVAGHPRDLSHLPESLHPNDAEVAIVERHFQALKTVTDEFNETKRNH